MRRLSQSELKEVIAGPAHRLDSVCHALMRCHFGNIVNQVWVHTDARAASSARKLNAKAYAVENHIVFGAGQYAPDSTGGRHLIAHELAHVAQQNCPVFAGWADTRRLEQEADLAATSAVAEIAMPAQFPSAARPGVPQFHLDTPCGESPEWESINATPPTIHRPANESIEIAYKAANGDAGVIVGSQFLYGGRPDFGIVTPMGTPNKAFADLLLRELKGLSRQLAPDIVDFRERVFYEIKTAKTARSDPHAVKEQLDQYYKLTELIRIKHSLDEPPWKSLHANWYPPHQLPFPGDPLNSIICTAATDYTKWPSGVILYEVLKRKKDGKRKQPEKQVAIEISLFDFMREFNKIYSIIDKEIHSQVRYFYPALPYFVVIAPVQFFSQWMRNYKRDLFRVKTPPFLDPHHPIGLARLSGWGIIGIATVTYGLLVAGTMIGLTASEFGAFIAKQGAAEAAVVGADAGPEVIDLTARRAALLSSSTAKQLAKAAAAGVLIILGNTNAASAHRIGIIDVGAIRMVPVISFQPFHDMQVANSGIDIPIGFMHTRETIKGQFKHGGQFALGKQVLYDNKPYVIIGQGDFRQFPW